MSKYPFCPHYDICSCCPSQAPPTAAILPIMAICLIFSACGCDSLFDSQRYETFTAPPERLRKIDALDLKSLSDEQVPRDANDLAGLAQPAPQVTLTIEECRAFALENNLDLKVQLFTPTIAGENINEAKAAFEPLVFSNFNFVKTDTPISLSLDSSQQKVISNNLGLSIPLRTGGNITLNMPFSRVETDNIFSTLNPSYSNDFSVSLRQPLLRQAGIRANTHAIRLARYGSQIAQAQTKLEVIRVLAAVDRLYWRLYAAREELKVRRQEHDLALAQWQRAKRMAQAGQVSEIEILRAEEAAAQRMEAIILAENEVRDRRRELKQILNKPSLQMETSTTLNLTTQPNPTGYILDTSLLIDYALDKRMELLELELQIAADNSTIDFERNGTLPLLAVDYTYNINGLGISADDAYDLMLENRFVDQRVGLVLQIPLGNRAALSRWRRALLQKQQRLASRDYRETLITREVLDAADQMQANWRRLLASRKTSLLAARTLEAEQRLFELGLQISTEVLNAQARFANAQSAQVRALAEYQIAQVDLTYAAGCLLGAAQVQWQPTPAITSQ